MKRVFALLMMLCIYSPTVYAGSITAGKPDHGGTDVWNVSLKNGNSAKVRVPLTGREEPAGKAEKIVMAINLAFGGVVVAGIDPGNPAKVVFNGAAIKTEDGTGETSIEAIVSLDADLSTGIGIAIIDYHGSLTGLDANGNESVFMSSLGFDGLLADFNRTFSSLSGPTINNLLTDTFNDFLSDLPLSLHPNLHLELANERIVFDLPPNQFNYFAQHFTSDITTQATGGIAPIPEPSSLLLFGVGILGLLGYGWRRRKQAARKT
ncbi:PEP-CTERM sorting domain-containing protein [Candidatus Poribacteria bacterium]|nr:PEP-CTERM sorting domain-containing protein [Candidatus Poribacteria bacterium]